MLLYFTYNEQGFETAKTETESGDPITLDEIRFIFDFATHDLFRGYCQSFQIYTETGALIFDSLFMKEAA